MRVEQSAYEVWVYVVVGNEYWGVTRRDEEGTS
jgi:hypothetical protein